MYMFLLHRIAEAGVSFVTFVNTVPIDENRAANHFALIRTSQLAKSLFNLDIWDKIVHAAMMK
jgi:hypothetical protein